MSQSDWSSHMQKSRKGHVVRMDVNVQLFKRSFKNPPNSHSQVS